MKLHAKLTRVSLICCLIFNAGCSKKDSTNNAAATTPAAGATGTLVFEGSVFQINTAVLGSSTITDRFTAFAPSWTPDGRIIFDATTQSSGKFQNEQIMIANVDGTGMTLLNDLGVEYADVSTNPKMSRDGKYFSYNFANSLSSETQGLRICNSNGTLLTTVPNLWEGTWAPDGSIIAAGSVVDGARYSNNYTPGTAGLFKISADFKSTTQIGSGLTTPTYPSVSPDGKRIAFSMNNHIWLINMDGTGLKQITTSSGVEINPTWSPDGNWIGTLSSGASAYIGGNGYALVSSNATTPTSLSASDKVWVQDKNSSTGVIEPTGNVSWK